MNNDLKKIAPILLFIGGVIIIFLLIANDNKDKKIKELKKEIDEHEDLTKEIKKKLKELIENNSDVEPAIANELSQIVALLEIKQDMSAVLKLAKIIENLLKELYKNDEKVKQIAQNNNRKRPVFADYLEHGKNEGVISTEDYHLISVLKIIRNEEAHDLDVKKEKSRIISSIVCGVGLILGLCRLLKRKTIELSKDK